MLFVELKKLCGDVTKVDVISVTGRPLAKNIYIKDSIIFDYIDIKRIENGKGERIAVIVNCR